MILRMLLSVCVVLAAARTLCAQTPDGGSGFFGKWVVTAVQCSDCGERAPAEKGAVIEFRATEIRNSLGEDCPREPGYGLLKEMSGQQVVAAYGKAWPPAVRRAALAREKIRYGLITCRGINFMQILFLSDERAFYFFEGGIVFDLEKAAPHDPYIGPQAPGARLRGLGSLRGASTALGPDAIMSRQVITGLA